MDKNKTYRIENGRVVTRSLEVSLVDHCNIRCWGCCALSPLLPEQCIDPERMRDDLALAASCIKPTWLKLVGGEPLLHPQVIDCIEIAKDSGVGEILSMTTNAFLLGKMPERLWILLDAMTISLYPQPILSDARRTKITALAQRHNVELNWKSQDQFVDMNRQEPMLDDAINREVYRTCWLRRRCHRLFEGRLYTCTRPPSYSKLFPHNAQAYLKDGIQLEDRAGMAEDIHAYLVSDASLETCRMCKGSEGNLQTHYQLTIPQIDETIATLTDAPIP